MKTHLILLDALRGVAALIVLWYHCFEGFGYEVAPGTGIYTQPCDHGYLAVDFFFLLSGFVIGYAYDDRWHSQLSVGQFFKRRLVRLHPMVVAGAAIGLVAFLLQGGVDWNGTAAHPRWIITALVMGLLMLPCWPGFRGDVRGNGEMFPLNGPNWSLFFEYIGNVLYALLLRRLPTWALTLLTVLTGTLLGHMVLTDGYLGVGWSFCDNGFWLGMLRMLFPYSLGMLMARLFAQAERRCVHFGAAFLLTSLMLLLTLPVPFIGDPAQPWQNGLYILILLMVVFPLIVWIGALAGTGSNRLATLLGELSYPLYAVHYPVMYLFYAYIGFPNVTCTMADVWPIALGAAALSILLAYVFWRFYDRPVRRWLSKR